MAVRASLAVPDELLYDQVMSRMLRYTAGPMTYQQAAALTIGEVCRLYAARKGLAFLTPSTRDWCRQLKRFAEDRASFMPDVIPAPAPWDDRVAWNKL